jgi:hypothetical protein
VPSSLIVPGGRPDPGPVNTTQPDPSEPVDVITAFLVYQEPNGCWGVADLDAVELKPQREVTSDDISAACANIVYDNFHCPYEDQREVECITAFVIFQLPNGLWQAAPQIDAPLIPQRKAIFPDIIGGSAVTMRDIHTREIAQQTSQATINAQFQVGQAIAEQRQNAMLQQQLEAEKDKARRGGR